MQQNWHSKALFFGKFLEFPLLLFYLCEVFVLSNISLYKRVFKILLDYYDNHLQSGLQVSEIVDKKTCL